MVIRLEILADELRQWAGKYETQVRPDYAWRFTPVQLGRAQERREKLPVIAELLERAATELYGLW